MTRSNIVPLDRRRVALAAAVVAASASALLLLGRPHEVVLEDAWIRAAEAGQSTAAYFTLENGTAGPVLLTGVQTSAATSAQLHETVREGGRVSMRQSSSVTVPPRGEVRFAPGGRHVMLLGLRATLTDGQRVDLAVTLADGRTLRANARVRS